MKTDSFPATSRYFQFETAKLVVPDGQGGEREIVYLRRRFVPPPENFATLQEHSVSEGDRLDNLTALYLGDPEQFWRLCDANVAMQPRELEEPAGRTVRITLPEGIPGNFNG